jgi:hypothetical protein
VLDTTHTLDAIMRDYRVEVLAGETLTVDQLDRLIQYAQAAHHMATAAISTKAHEKVALAFEQHLEMQGQLVASALGAAIDKLGLTEPWRVYALEVASRALAVAGGHDVAGDEPRPPDDPVVQEYDISPRDVPAIEAAPTVRAPSTSPGWTTRSCATSASGCSTGWEGGTSRDRIPARSTPAATSGRRRRRFRPRRGPGGCWRRRRGRSR